MHGVQKCQSQAFFVDNICIVWGKSLSTTNHPADDQLQNKQKIQNVMSFMLVKQLSIFAHDKSEWLHKINDLPVNRCFPA